MKLMIVTMKNRTRKVWRMTDTPKPAGLS